MKRSYLGALLASLPFCTHAVGATAPSYALIDLGESDYSGQGMLWADRSVAQTYPTWPQVAPCTGSNHSTVVTPFFYIESLSVALGVSCTTTGVHAAKWTFNPETPITLTDIGVLPGALMDNSGALGSNEVGDVVGASASAYTDTYGSNVAFHAFLWNSGKMTDLGSIAGPHYTSSAVAVNDSHEVIGVTDTISSTTGGVLKRVFLYTNGTMYNLTFFTTSGPTALLSDAQWIDCQGNISAFGFPANQPGIRHAYLLMRQGPARTCKSY